MSEQAMQPEQEGAAPAGLGDSLYDEEFLQLIRDAHARLESIQDKRAELNADKAHIMAALIDKGLNKDAFKAARKYELTPEEKREGYDLSYQIARKALGVPVQDDLFVAAAEQQVKAHGKKKH